MHCEVTVKLKVNCEAKHAAELLVEQILSAILHPTIDGDNPEILDYDIVQVGDEDDTEQPSIESAFYALRRECSRKDARIAKLTNQLNEYQNVHNGTSIHCGIGQTITIDKPMQLLSVRRNGTGPFLCSIDGEGMTILFKTNAIAGPKKDNPFNNSMQNDRD